MGQRENLMPNQTQWKSENRTQVDLEQRDKERKKKISLLLASVDPA